jgi:UDP:flavonoid glycosyltransferase YjiC (YdhE family)
VAEVLVVTWDGGGNVPPALGIAGELVRRGHRVRFLGHERQRSSVEEAGFGFEAYRHARPYSAI